MKFLGKTICLIVFLSFGIFGNAQTDKEVEEMIAQYHQELDEHLIPIQENANRIDGISNWSSIISIHHNESTEGGTIFYYYQEEELEKIIVHYLGETGRIVRALYLLDGELSFVLEKDYRYNRPIYWDEAMSMENGDSEVFDFSRSEVTESRSYFKNNELIHRLEEDCGSHVPKDYLEEESKRLNYEFNQLLSQREKVQIVN